MLREVRLTWLLQRRIERSDPATVLDPDLLATAQELAEVASSPAAFGALARFHQIRFNALPVGADNTDFLATGRWLAKLPPEVVKDLPEVWRALAGFGGSAHALLLAATELAGRLDGVDDAWGWHRCAPLWREALAALPAGHPDRANALANAANTLLSRAQRTTSHPQDIPEAIALYRSALELMADDDAHRPQVIGNLAVAYQQWYEQTDTPGDLDEAARLLRIATATGPAGTAAWQVKIYQLANVLLAQAQLRRPGANLDEAAALVRTLIDTPGTAVPRAAVRNLLVGVLQARYDERGDPGDLSEALAIVRETLDTEPMDPPDRIIALNALSTTQLTRYRLDNDLDTLDEAIDAAREIVRLCPQDHPFRAGAVNNLGQLLQRRGVRTGATEDLDAAVTAAGSATRMLPAGHSDAAGFVGMRGVTLFTRFLQTRERQDLDEAVALTRQATELVPVGHHARTGLLSNLGTALSMRAFFADVPDPAAFMAAIDVHREVVDTSRADDPQRPGRIVNLVMSINAMTRSFPDSALLDEAIDRAAEALACLPVGRGERVGALVAAGRAASLRYEHRRRQADAEMAVAVWEELAGNASAPVRNRIHAARGAADLLAQRHGLAAGCDGYAAAVGLLPLLAWRGLSRADRQRLLGEMSGLAAEAAAAAIAAGRPERAVELLEQARGVLWTQLLEARTEVADLREIAPDLAEEFEAARDSLNATIEGVGDLVLSDLVDRRGAVAARFDAVVARIRGLPPSAGFPRPDRFLRPATWSEIRGWVARRDVVLVTASRWRCDALVISRDEVKVVELPDLTVDAIGEHLISYLGIATGTAHRELVPPDGVRSRTSRTHAWLWSTIAAPVLTALDRPARPAGWPRLWWCPTGLLALLPLHAADGVLDRVISSSYVPTLRALGRDDVDEASGQAGRPLAVAMPETPGHPDLPAVEEEVRTLRRVLPGLRVLSGRSATRQAVAEGLSSHRIVHLSCHGTQDLTDPSRGGLALVDGLLTINDLLGAAGAAGEFVYLSACKTATGGLLAADESITLAAALSYGGWRHVVGTLWSIDDAVASQVARLVYEKLATDGDVAPERAAAALHLTLRQLRRERPHRQDLWAPFVHLGT
ncbi:CHAT domain-containing protein [Solwaraspora sp. WMMB335]|uniref:CHAT domain-containing protein n=1 Tax=Solwaraspora sp. WMMB335 TaxID=3404118 RepID=UPI003B955EE0